MSRNIDKIYDSVLLLTKELGKLIKQRVWTQKTVEQKADETDLVTETDKEIERRLIEGLLAEYPDHKFIAEESTASGVKPELTVAPTWIIDPLDGTLNFVHGYPIVCISIALLIDKTTEIGIIYNPIFELLFSAKRGQGAFMNGNKINVSKTTELNKTLIQFSLGPTRDTGKMNAIVDNMNVLRPLVQAIRSTGSSAFNMSMVGLGGADAFVDFGLHAWDMAAGDLIIREAGGFVMDPLGGPLDLMSCRVLCASTDNLAKQLVSILKQYYPTRDDA